MNFKEPLTADLGMGIPPQKDRIKALQNGRILEEGRHADLLARGGLYSHLWSLQFAEVDGA